MLKKRCGMIAHEDHNQPREQPFPCYRKACAKSLEPGLGDVVSANLQCLVNKLCEAATSSFCCRLMPLIARLAQISSIFQKRPPGRWQNWRSLADGNIQFAVRYFIKKFIAQNYGYRSKTIESIGGRVAAEGRSLADIPKLSAPRPVCLWGPTWRLQARVSATGPEAKSKASIRDISSRIRGVPHDPANLIGREAATWDRGRSYAHERGSFDTE